MYGLGPPICTLPRLGGSTGVDVHCTRNAPASRSPLGSRIGLTSRSNSSADCLTTSASLPTRARRSEEHTSELQSLMRISYAVFCLKKKKIHTLHHPNNTYISTSKTNYTTQPNH